MKVSRCHVWILLRAADGGCRTWRLSRWAAVKMEIRPSDCRSCASSEKWLRFSQQGRFGPSDCLSTNQSCTHPAAAAVVRPDRWAAAVMEKCLLCWPETHIKPNNWKETDSKRYEMTEKCGEAKTMSKMMGTWETPGSTPESSHRRRGFGRMFGRIKHVK